MATGGKAEIGTIPDLPLPTITDRPIRPVPIQSIIGAVCDALRVPGESFYGKTRHPVTVLARMLVVTLARRLTLHSYPELAREMNRPNHSTPITEARRFIEQRGKTMQEYVGSHMTCPDMTLEQLADRLASGLVDGT